MPTVENRSARLASLVRRRNTTMPSIMSQVPNARRSRRRSDVIVSSGAASYGRSDEQLLMLPDVLEAERRSSTNEDHALVLEGHAVLAPGRPGKVGFEEP